MPPNRSVRLFPDWGDPAVAVGSAWQVDGTPLPVPRFQPTCFSCDGKDVLLRSYHYFDRGITSRFRCDVTFKCLTCSAVWTHGLAIQPSQRKNNGHYVEWRQARELLTEAGVIDGDGYLNPLGDS
ncbi:MAG: hypothetical protein ACR2FE_08835 [Aeromicrobium sp.]